MTVNWFCCDNYRLTFNFARPVPIEINKKKLQKRQCQNTLYFRYLSVRSDMSQNYQREIKCCCNILNLGNNSRNIDVIFYIANKACIPIHKPFIEVTSFSDLTERSVVNAKTL